MEFSPSVCILCNTWFSGSFWNVEDGNFEREGKGFKEVQLGGTTKISRREAEMVAEW